MVSAVLAGGGAAVSADTFGIVAGRPGQGSDAENNAVVVTVARR